ncbi:hypothetical protein LMG7974_00321 [Campylobacter majalis]|uniref:TonB C-terminal domain-containing protein n=1 Tax=Campylobacter majalis TaxID=2790656 RepID=A0ABM8Q3U8_9BACT|nr:energy transducer TonB [Campylobacter majalis]CAD7287442.1 hypothetical protein LMG7974_00321 [Campylobacter majalis]
MRTLQSQHSQSKAANASGFAISFLLHSAAVYFFIFHNPFVLVKPVEDAPIKISLNVYKPVTAPVQAPEITPPVAPPEPIVTPPAPPPEPIVKKEKPKKKPDPLKKVAKKPEPMPEPIVAKEQPTPPAPPSPPAPPVNATPGPVAKQATAPTIGEFNLQSSAGDENFGKIRKAIEKHKKYPKNAQKMRQQGIAEVRFIYKKDGSVGDIQIIKSSGYTSLDESVINTIQKASKDFPKLDIDYRITIPIGFKLV